MAEITQSKRQREEEEDYNECEVNDNNKRCKTSSSSSYNQILSILDEAEEDEPNQEMLDIFQSLQQELSSDSTTVDPLQISASPTEVADHQSGGGSAVSDSCSPSSKEDDGVNMMRHLLEASDDELGLPNRWENGDEEINSGENHLFLGDGLWEFEDDAANYYYSMMQSELFM